MIGGHDESVLQFHREAARVPHLVVIEGGRRGTSPGRAPDDQRSPRDLRLGPIMLVVLATLVAVFVDLVDNTPAWSPWAVLGTALVLLAHLTVQRLRSH